MSIKIGSAAINGLRDNNHASRFSSGDQIFTARVYYTLLTNDKKKILEMDVKPGSIGFVQCRRVFNGQVDDNSPFIVAAPLDSSNRKFPIQNELVLVIAAPTSLAVDGTDNTIPSYYYISTLGVWDSPEHNSLPDNSFFDKKRDIPSNASYTGTQTGISKQSENSQIKPVTGNGFTERGDIRKLVHLPGDIVHEGRFGNSIRFGTSNELFDGVPWKGKSNQPVTIISNDRKNTSGNSWEPVFEDINNDGSIIGMFSSQIIDFIPANDNFKSYNQNIPIPSKNNIIKQSVATGSVNKTIIDTDNKDIIDIKPIVYTTAITSTVTGSIIDEIQFIPDQEDQFQFTKEFDDLVIGIVEKKNLLSSVYSISVNNTKNKGENLTVNRADIKEQIKKGNYATLTLFDKETKIVSISEVARIINNLIQSNIISKVLGRCILATGINEQRNGNNLRAYNNNFFAVTTDSGRWSSGPNFPNVKIAGQIIIKQNEDGQIRPYAVFNSVEDSVKFIADAFLRKSLPVSSTSGFNDILSDSKDSENYAKLYITRWYVKPLTTKLISDKMVGYELAKKYIP